MTERVRKAKVDRHERLMRKRVLLEKSVSREQLVELVDYLYFELDLLIYEVEALKADGGRKHDQK